jgi:endonuclease YncB( thermonuclease family)
MIRWLILLTAALAAPAPTSGVIESVYDGDTFTLDDHDKVRLRWVNTPELRPLEPFGEEAKQFATDFLLRRKVALSPASSPRDSYGRLVAGVATEAGDLSLALVKAGLAHVFIIPPDDTDVTELLAAQAEARAARRGIWSTDAYQGALHLTSFHANAPGDDAENLNGEYLRVANVSTEVVDLGGWKFRNQRGEEYPLPSVKVPAGYTVQVRSGTGLDAIDPRWQLEVHLRATREVWNNDGDRATLVGPDGRDVDSRTHKGG